MIDRPSLDDTLMSVARVWSQRATCSRLKVGAVLSRNGHQLAQGYNGTPSGLPHCSHDVDEKCTESNHGEANVIAHAARYGQATDGATMYVTHSPCVQCAGLIVNAGIREVVFAEPYRDAAGIERLQSAGVVIRRMGNGDD